MEISPTPHMAARVAFYAIMVCWWVFALTFWLRKRPVRAREAKRDWTSSLSDCCYELRPISAFGFIR